MAVANEKKTINRDKPKKTRQGKSCNTKLSTNKNSKLYSKRYRGQGK